MVDKKPRKITLIVEEENGTSEVFEIPRGFEVRFTPKYGTDSIPRSSPLVVVPRIEEIDIHIDLWGIGGNPPPYTHRRYDAEGKEIPNG